METVRIRDPGWEKMKIRDKHPGSATLHIGTGSVADPDPGSGINIPDPQHWVPVP